MKKILERVIRYRNPLFRFDINLDGYMLLQFLLTQIRCICRGYRVTFFGRAPKGMMLERGVRFFNIRRIKWGRFLRLGEHVYIGALGKEGVTFGNNVSIGAYSRLIVSTSLNAIGTYIRIGNNVGMGEFSYLGGAGGLEIGDDCIIGQYLSCHPEDHVFSNTSELIRMQGVIRKGIKIGNNCWVGSKVTILDGVVIGEGSVVAAGAVVTRSMPANSVIGGVPAKVIKQRDNNTQGGLRSSAVTSVTL